MVFKFLIKMRSLKGKKAVVTGGNSGIGYAAAAALKAQGAEVIITGRRSDAIQKAASGLGVRAFTADQADLEHTNLLVDHVREHFGEVDILFINAGVTGLLTPIENASVENFDNVMNINFRGAYFTLSRFIPILSDGASVVILSSMVAGTYKPNSSVYQASKAALNSIAKTAAAELAPRKIRVNIISPGPTRTEVMRKAGLDEATLQNVMAGLQDVIPLKKIGSPEDVAQLVVYLSSDAAGFITGSEFVIDGGLTL
jgi:NAD(P)-dependent dehydrogenase (short-subunit alcohol dehydrogenase family)